jgi:hypothetical protein
LSELVVTVLVNETIDSNLIFPIPAKVFGGISFVHIKCEQIIQMLNSLLTLSIISSNRESLICKVVWDDTSLRIRNTSSAFLWPHRMDLTRIPIVPWTSISGDVAPLIPIYKNKGARYKAMKESMGHRE